MMSFYLSRIFSPSRRFQNLIPFRNYATSSSSSSLQRSHALEFPPCRKRVLGIIAHINSGKTTTTEAMLFKSGTLSRMGNVDTGDTTTDHLPAERERGITVSSASASLIWREHQIYLIDSPGHVDFTFEVDRALRVMDSAIVILDGVNGVQAQTEVVWKQADNNKLPRLIFINKLDRDGSDFQNVIDEVKKKFGSIPIVTSVPIFDKQSGNLKGIHNILSTFNENVENEINKDHEIVENELIECCAQFDDDVMNAWIDGLRPKRKQLVNAIRQACISCKGVPVVCGSSLHEIGIDNLLNSIIAFLPSPKQEEDNDQPFIAYAFKVIHDKHRGRLVFMRCFSGNLSKRTILINTTKQGLKESPTRFLTILADKYVDVDSISTGDIFAVVGLKSTGTGDTVMKIGVIKNDWIVLKGVPIPPGVFTIALETESSAYERDLHTALERIVDEDSSLEIRRDEDTGETLLCGMGELHLEVTVDHMRRKLPFQIYATSPRVAYRETITTPIINRFIEHTAYGKSTSLTISIHEIDCNDDDDNIIDVECETQIHDDVVQGIEQGIQAALGRGPLLGLPVRKVHVTVVCHNVPDVTSGRMAAVNGVKVSLEDGNPGLLEPVVDVSISVPERYVGDIVSELTHPTRRRGIITDIMSDTDILCEIKAIVPVQGMLGFTTKFRSITKGRGDLQMTFKQFQIIDKVTQQNIIEQY